MLLQLHQTHVHVLVILVADNVSFLGNASNNGLNKVNVLCVYSRTTHTSVRHTNM